MLQFLSLQHTQTYLEFLRSQLSSIFCHHLKRPHEYTWRLATTKLIFSIDLKGSAVNNRWIKYVYIDQIKDDKYISSSISAHTTKWGTPEMADEYLLSSSWTFWQHKRYMSPVIKGIWKGTEFTGKRTAYLIDSSARVFKQLFCPFYAHLSCNIQQNLPAIHEIIQLADSTLIEKRTFRHRKEHVKFQFAW